VKKTAGDRARREMCACHGANGGCYEPWVVLRSRPESNAPFASSWPGSSPWASTCGQSVIPGPAAGREPGIHCQIPAGRLLWIPGSRCARPGMTGQSGGGLTMLTHMRACPGHPRLPFSAAVLAWTPVTDPRIKVRGRACRIHLGPRRFTCVLGRAVTLRWCIKNRRDRGPIRGSSTTLTARPGSLSEAPPTRLDVETRLLR
jgi:hypothetical protein